LVILGDRFFILLRGFPAIYAIPIGAAVVLVATVSLLNYGFYSIFCISESKISYRQWFGLVQHELPVAALDGVENVRTHGSRGHTWILVIRWSGGKIRLNRSYYRKVQIANVVRLIARHAPSAQMPPAVLSLAEVDR